MARVHALAVLLLTLALSGCTQPPARDSVTVLLTDDVLTLDPNEEIETVTDSVLFNVYEPLVGFDADLKIQPVLAESWEHPSPQRWRFQLRRGVRFHDGTPLTASLARESLLSVQGNPQLEASQFLSPIREISVLGESTLDIVTVQPRAILASLPFVYIVKPNAKAGDPPLVGTGPYQIRERKRGEHVVLERWPGFRGPLPAAREARFEAAPEPKARLERLARGDADVVYGVEPLQAIRKIPGVRFVRRPGLTVYYLGFDVRRRRGNPFRDPRVRRALHLAIDREDIVERAYLGMASVASQPVSPLVFGYNPGLPLPEHKPDLARRLLAEAGYPRGFETRLDIFAGRAVVARLIQQQLRQIGVELAINALDGDQIYRVAESGESPIFFLGWDCTTGEASEFYEFCLHTPGRGYGKGNYGGYSNATIDEIAESNATILDPRERRRLLESAATLAMDELPVLPLYVVEEVYGVREGILFRPRADNQIKLTDVGFESR